ncbi:TPA: hypothetical protein ACH3X1_013947 [Trebouxia sp. C0004]
MWQYLGFENKGIYYCFKVLPFGISIACWNYSVIKQEMYRPARNQGACLQYLIDDRCALGSNTIVTPNSRL